MTDFKELSYFTFSCPYYIMLIMFLKLLSFEPCISPDEEHTRFENIWAE